MLFRSERWLLAARTTSLRSNAGGEHAAAMYTLMGSAKLHGIDPEAYLSHVLARIADHPITRIEELLSWNVDLPRKTEID